MAFRELRSSLNTLPHWQVRFNVASFTSSPKELIMEANISGIPQRTLNTLTIVGLWAQFDAVHGVDILMSGWM